MATIADLDPQLATILEQFDSELKQSESNDLETNIKHMKLKCVALSSVIYRNNWFLDFKNKMVNNHIRSFCGQNDWVYVDNDNIDESCLLSDNLHLNKTGLERTTVNLRLALGNFMKSGIQKVPYPIYILIVFCPVVFTKMICVLVVMLTKVLTS